MPELPEVEAVRRELEPVMHGARFERVLVRRPDLRRPFPRRFAARLSGRTVRALTRRGKYLLAELSSDETLLMHLGMSGSFRLDHFRPGAARPRGVRDVERNRGDVQRPAPLRRDGSRRHAPAGRLPALRSMGLEPLGDDFDGAALARACVRRRIPIKVALLDQRVVAGVGNIYASEALNLAGLSPRQRASSIATPGGAPKPAAHRLAAAIKRVLRSAIARQTAATYRRSRFRVYDREGEPCPTRGCAGTIVRLDQAGRSTFYCPVCQRAQTSIAVPTPRSRR